MAVIRLVGPFDSMLQSIVAVACDGKTDEAGRTIYETDAKLDTKGPRRFVLTTDATRLLGTYLIIVMLGGLAIATSALEENWARIVVAIITLSLFFARKRVNTFLGDMVERYAEDVSSEG